MCIVFLKFTFLRLLTACCKHMRACKLSLCFDWSLADEARPPQHLNTELKNWHKFSKWQWVLLVSCSTVASSVTARDPADNSINFKIQTTTTVQRHDLREDMHTCIT